MLEKRKGWKILSIFLAFALAFTTAAMSVQTADAATVKPKSITIKTNAPKKIVDVKGRVNVSVKSVKPANASKSVTWKSSDKKIATVSSKGVVTGKKAGKVKITAISKANKKVKKSLTLTVKNIKPSSVKLSKTKATLYPKGGALKLEAAVNPVGVYNKGVTWSSSDKSVAAVSSKGVVTPKKAGTAVITVKTKENKKAAKCTVTVKNADVLIPYCMVGFYNKTKLNYEAVAADAQVRIWDPKAKAYADGKNNSAAILGNYVQLVDWNKDKKADLIEVVKFKDGAAKWNAKQEWLDGVGEEGGLSNEEGREMFENTKYRIPMGERLLTGFGLTGGSGTTDISNLDETTYWPDYDYYNVKSSDSLTMLTGYKTQLQTTGWTCVLSSALSVLEWYGQRADLNEQDLASLRSDTRSRRPGATSLKELNNVFKKLTALKLTGQWITESSLDSDDAAEKIYDPAWLKGHLEQGHPIMVIWNSYGGHGQVIIGYDDMGTPDKTSDDVLIMMDPYDSTDHNANGYIIQSYERLIYGLSDEAADGISAVRYMVAYPKDKSAWNYTIDRTGEGIKADANNTIKSKSVNKLNDKLYAKTAADLKEYYLGRTDIEGLDDWIYLNEEKGLGGPAGIEDTEYAGNYNHSPYYKFFDFYNGQGPTKTLDILDNFKTIQQSTEWACGCTSSVMVMEHFNKNKNNETDMSLSNMRQNGYVGPTFVSGMEEIFTKMNTKNSDDWVFFTSDDLEYKDDYSFIGDYCLEWGKADNGLIPYLIEHDIPMMIGWDEWGGHWQTIIGYDDMGTPEKTQDDVLILADSYDTTDHDQDGYFVESFERLVYGWNVQFELDEANGGSGSDYIDFIVAFPRAGNEQVIKDLGLK